uniref:Uncharacterized protein n=1 Tax=Anguilla anguilla TaxID=7936 RepID=A0A0E9RKE1_ANGAN
MVLQQESYGGGNTHTHTHTQFTHISPAVRRSQYAAC